MNSFYFVANKVLDENIKCTCNHNNDNDVRTMTRMEESDQGTHRGLGTGQDHVLSRTFLKQMAQKTRSRRTW